MLNPITYTEKVARDFLRYQLSAYPLADGRMQAQMRELLSLEHTRKTPLMKGPFISLSQQFRRGVSVRGLVEEGFFHRHMPQIVPHEYLYGHQEGAIRQILAGHTTLVSTGTGSGKTESFLYPIISRCLELRDQGAPPGIVAVIIYPMNALAEDQLGRLRELLCGTGVSFGMYVGKTPENRAGVTGIRLPASASRASYFKELEKQQGSEAPRAIHPPEERASRQEMRASGGQPRILLTNVKQLELLLTRQRDVELFDGASLEYLVVDEAHTFSGAMGAETACLIRRLRAYCGRSNHDTVCVATSATIVDRDGPDKEARQFASRFFGVDASGVKLVSEEYEEDTWAEELIAAPVPGGDPLIQLDNMLQALRRVDDDGPTPADLAHLKTYLQTLFGARLEMSDWRGELYRLLSQSELVYALAKALRSPRALSELCVELSERFEREVHEAEVLMWLAMGSAARREGRPLLRPVVHAFVRGVDGAVVTFPAEQDHPRLWLAAQDAVEADDSLRRLAVTTCTTCGQHYFEHHVEDFAYFGRAPGGGHFIDGVRLWPALETNERGASRLLLLDRLAFLDDEDFDEEELQESGHRRLSPLYFCRNCGGLHSEERPSCASCGRSGSLLRLYGVQQKVENPGYLTACVACSARGGSSYGKYREPARPIRAVNVSDIHILAQSMLQHAQRKRLLIFADNRQDAAFQAGWMKDHARRFRLRALIHEILDEHRAHSPGDLVYQLDGLLEDDDDLSRALIPEVWQVARKERTGKQHRTERRKYLRLQLMRELAISSRQSIGLEPWGRILISYEGLGPHLNFIQRWAPSLGLSPEELTIGVASLLDDLRRKKLLHDPETKLFTRYWNANAREVEWGYIPLMDGAPAGLKLRREEEDNARWVKQLISSRGLTPARQAATKWGVEKEEVEYFLSELWTVLTEELKLLVPVTLTGWGGQALPDCKGVYQVDADSLRIHTHREAWICSKCRRSYPRRAPRHICMGWHCDGQLRFTEESEDNYDLMLLDEQFTLVRPHEHSAQVPSAQRDELERQFKSAGERVNVLVSTPTLELGVDIGSLDSVLMRNVPPLASNYWQRAGRAGRRHRMAVNLTYARPVSHDRAYFEEPLKLLDGKIYPPSFNLKNEVMVRKHVHSTVLTILRRWAQEDASAARSLLIQGALEACFPTHITAYLFDQDGSIRSEPFDTDSLIAITTQYKDELLEQVQQTFEQGWPQEDLVVVKPLALERYIEEMGHELRLVIRRLEQRRDWALHQLDRLERERKRLGVLDHEDEELYHRCGRLIKSLKGRSARRFSQQEGVDETYTYAVLAAEGYLPGYGLDSGSISATHLAPERSARMKDWTLQRAPSLALREYVPGNLIYANGHRFTPRYYRLEAEDPTIFQVDIQNEAIRQEGVGPAYQAASLGDQYLAAVPICDVQLPHQSNISDDELYRYRLSSAVYGYELERHDEGRAYQWGDQKILWRRSVHLRLVNVGPNSMISGGKALGFPMCTVCGQSNTPFISEETFLRFQEAHLKRCGHPPGRVGIFADIVADMLLLRDYNERIDGYSVIEALRHGAARVIDMELGDLQILAIGRPGSPKIDMALYDAMPGGSGLLEQIIHRFDEVWQAALEIIENCASDCETACIDCLLNYRNAHYHRYLHRHQGIESLTTAGSELIFAHDIPPRLPDEAQDAGPTNQVEELLEQMLLRAGFPRPEAQKSLDLGRPLGRTLPDFFYEDPTGFSEGICVYLDGEGKYLGSPSQRGREQELRQELRARGFVVLEIGVASLRDRTSMAQYLQMLARPLLGPERAAQLREDPTWFNLENEEA